MLAHKRAFAPTHKRASLGDSCIIECLNGYEFGAEVPSTFTISCKDGVWEGLSSVPECTGE